MNIPYKLGTALGNICFTLFGDWQVSGKPFVPPFGPLIVVSNHLSNADPPVLISSIPRQMAFLAKEELFNKPILNTLFKSLGAHPLSRSGPDITAIRWASRMIETDRAVLLFPEGTRSPTGALQRGMPGSAYLALQTQAPILPVAITGTESIPGLWRVAFPLTKIRVTIGSPFTLPEIEGRPSKDILQSLSDMIMMRIADLLPSNYRGYYASSSRVLPGDASNTSQ